MAFGDRVTLDDLRRALRERKAVLLRVEDVAELLDEIEGENDGDDDRA